MPEQLTQLNVHIPNDVVETVERLRDRYGWSKRDLVMKAIRALAQVMDAHEAYAAQHDDDIAQVYLRLAAEMPAGFVEVPKEGVRVGRAAKTPAVMIDDTWLVWADPASGNLFAEEQGGARRVGVVAAGEIKPLKIPTAEEVSLN
jgi:hypothetical protein